MNKTTIGLAAVALLTASSTASALTGPMATKPDGYNTTGATVHATGTVITTTQDAPLKVTFTPQTLLSTSSVRQVAAIVQVQNAKADTWYEVGNLTATGADAGGYETESNAAVAVYQSGKAANTVNKGILSDGTTFFVNIYHRAILPEPGETTLDLPITSYTK
ncbi:hypothetical protein CED64_22060 [Salmonella enterica]|nr:hypothetical protein [Salmonella enterica subsp. diarizonae]EAS4230338.1 hypothetical protein [Salmonella enterica]EBW4112703.1 hypothetical protein [Salmonella enterica subsp. enterica serovar Oranienburg]EIG1170782.1 hypothetical protein [Salmonella enterica subsp. diarizonae serovar 48:k:z53]EKR1420760.1 hypothetical protein [Salmonella enterica subsp. diarizonae serovar 50:z:z52]